MQQKFKKLAGITTYLSILTLNFNELNSPFKRYQLAKGLKKKTLQSVIYKKPALQTETNIAQGEKQKIY
jgi:hypothetical protein